MKSPSSQISGFQEEFSRKIKASLGHPSIVIQSTIHRIIFLLSHVPAGFLFQGLQAWILANPWNENPLHQDMGYSPKPTLDVQCHTKSTRATAILLASNSTSTHIELLRRSKGRDIKIKDIYRYTKSHASIWNLFLYQSLPS